MKVKIRIAQREFDSVSMKEVDAEIYGPVAVTWVDSFGHRYYRITHVKSGYAIGASIPTKYKAIKLAKSIMDHAEIFTGLSTSRRTKRNKVAGKLFRSLWVEAGLEAWWEHE